METHTCLPGPPKTAIIMMIMIDATQGTSLGISSHQIFSLMTLLYVATLVWTPESELRLQRPISSTCHVNLSPAALEDQRRSAKDFDLKG